jgi:hypothetical protein
MEEGDFPQIKREKAYENLFGVFEISLCQEIARAGYPKYILSENEQNLCRYAANHRMENTMTGALFGFSLGALVSGMSYFGLKRKHLRMKAIGTISSTIIFSTLTFFVALTDTVNGWVAIDLDGEYAQDEISFMAEFARKFALENGNWSDSSIPKPKLRYTKDELDQLYEQQLRGELMSLSSISNKTKRPLGKSAAGTLYSSLLRPPPKH